MPPERAASVVGGPVETITRESGQIDTTDECHGAVDDDQLLVTAVHRTVAWIEGTLNPGVANEPIHEFACSRARRLHDRQRRPGPHEHADIDPLRRFSEEVAHRYDRGVALDSESRVDRPTGDVHERTGATHGCRDRRQRRQAVDMDLEAVAAARWRILCPDVGRPTQTHAARGPSRGAQGDGCGGATRRSR
jgi:hypothetical protein